MTKLTIVITSLLLMLSGTSRADDKPLPPGPALGQAATRAEIAAWDITVMPDGSGLPAGQGTALEGRIIYVHKCQSCHGPEGEGASADQLAHARMQLTDEWPEKTIGNYWPNATTLFDFNRRSMPMTAPASMTDNEVYAVTAYLLFLNNIIGEDTVINAKSLPAVRMPNRDGFINLYELNKNSNKP